VPALICPNGHRFESKPIIYGLPDAETSAAGERGEVVLAGCDPGDPVTIACPRCGAEIVRASDWASGRSGEASGEPR
jgi:hypothetical protein